MWFVSSFAEATPDRSKGWKPIRTHKSVVCGASLRCISRWRRGAPVKVCTRSRFGGGRWRKWRLNVRMIAQFVSVRVNVIALLGPARQKTPANSLRLGKSPAISVYRFVFLDGSSVIQESWDKFSRFMRWGFLLFCRCLFQWQPNDRVVPILLNYQPLPRLFPYGLWNLPAGHVYRCLSLAPSRGERCRSQCFGAVWWDDSARGRAYGSLGSHRYDAKSFWQSAGRTFISKFRKIIFCISSFGWFMLLYFHVPSCALLFLVILLRFDVNSPPEHSFQIPFSDPSKMILKRPPCSVAWSFSRIIITFRTFLELVSYMVSFGVHWANHESFDKDYIVFKCQLSTENHCSVYGTIFDNSQTCCYRNMIPDHNNFPPKNDPFHQTEDPVDIHQKLATGDFRMPRPPQALVPYTLLVHWEIWVLRIHYYVFVLISMQEPHMRFLPCTWPQRMGIWWLWLGGHTWWEFSFSKGGGCIVFSYIFFLYGVLQGECPSYC